ncbi:NAD(P)-binding protein [Aaosphaeria arxii CBS 175.79]|uniref:Probable quinone oxidoreductase n=1 Tax=Aaosphaeria arxii CBS 175.79 TaxID=1450172 RepID=A0A6A5XAH8_9PLEO|nr:NAD(P)-binding protein [Aaosphaeria arxii CBS 175.79]KAF2010065.1 NAD(P)-binding protein [Aaosphaeria arxii CBS 175.79]
MPTTLHLLWRTFFLSPTTTRTLTKPITTLRPPTFHLHPQFQPFTTSPISTKMALPKTTPQVSISTTGPPSLLTYTPSSPLPTPPKGHALVRNAFIGINYIDTYFRSGLYPIASFPFVPGREASGVVVAFGPDTSPPSATKDGKGVVEVGSRVAYLHTATYAGHTVVPVEALVPVPDGVGDEVAAASLLQGLTALTLIREAHRVERGDWVLVTAAAGGVGGWLCQLLRAVGARTIAVASSEEKRGLARENGAEVAIGYGEEDREKFVEEVLGITGGEGVAAVFDSVGKATFDSVLKVVRRKGSLISFGNASGAVEGFALGRLGAKNVRLMRPTLFNFIATREELLGYAEELWGFVERGEVKVHIHEIYPLEDVVRATVDIESRKTTGKLLLKP